MGEARPRFRVYMSLFATLCASLGNIPVPILVNSVTCEQFLSFKDKTQHATIASLPHEDGDYRRLINNAVGLPGLKVERSGHRKDYLPSDL